MIKQRLFTPGPTDVPPEVLNEMAKPIFHHRTSRFKKMFGGVLDGLKKLLMTQNDVMVLAGSGTAGMEAAIVTCCPRDKKCLVANGGKFGERWVKVAKIYGLNVDEVKVEWGTAITPEAVQQKLATGEYGSVIVVHSETSTATNTDIEGIGKVVAKSDAILLVDAISSAGSLPLKADEWNLDIVVVGSQKALMLPPGLAIVSVSPKAWKKAEAIKPAAFYLDLKAYRKSLADADTPYTPAITLIRGLAVALDMIHAVGIEKMWQRTALLAEASRAAAKAMGLTVFSKQPSDSVTGLMYPEGVDDAFRKALEKNYGANVAGGQDALKNKAFRISHMGYADPMDTLGLIAAIGYCLEQLGAKVDTQAGMAAAVKVLRNWN